MHFFFVFPFFCGSGWRRWRRRRRRRGLCEASCQQLHTTASSFLQTTDVFRDFGSLRVFGREPRLPFFGLLEGSDGDGGGGGVLALSQGDICQGKMTAELQLQQGERREAAAAFFFVFFLPQRKREASASNAVADGTWRPLAGCEGNCKCRNAPLSD